MIPLSRRESKRGQVDVYNGKNSVGEGVRGL